MNRVIFVHIPKTAGTSILSFFKEHGVRLVVADPWPVSRLRYRKHRPILDWSACARRSTPSFAVLRNPESWIRSYYSFISLTEMSPDTGAPWRHGLHSLVRDLDLDGFVREVCENDLLERLFSFRRLRRYGHARFDQSSFVSSPMGEVLVRRLMPFEDLDRHLKDYFLIDAPGAALPVVNRSATGNPSVTALSHASRLLIADRFARDTELHETLTQDP